MTGLATEEAEARFTAAHAFHLAAKRCLAVQQEGGGPARLVSPSVVNLCLAAELYLKLIIVLGGGAYSKTHSLSQLLTALPAAIQNTIARSCRATAGDLSHLHDIVDLTSDDFVQWRYAHEAELVFGSPTELDQVCDALHATVKHLRPELRSAFERGGEVG